MPTSKHANGQHADTRRLFYSHLLNGVSGCLGLHLRYSVRFPFPRRASSLYWKDLHRPTTRKINGTGTAVICVSLYCACHFWGPYAGIPTTTFACPSFSSTDSYSVPLAPSFTHSVTTFTQPSWNLPLPTSPICSM